MLCYKLLISVTALLGCFPSHLFGGIDVSCKDAFMGFSEKGSINHDQEMHAAHESIGRYFEGLDYKVPSAWNLITIKYLVVFNSIISTLKEVDNDIYICFSWRCTSTIIFDLTFDLSFLEKVEFPEMCFLFPHVMKN